MTLCKFFAQGSCKFGDKCRFEHPRNASHNHGQYQKPFQATQSNSFHQQNGFQRPAPGARPLPSRNYQFSVQTDQIEADLTLERPTWILSSYGPGRDAPRQMFGDYPLEQSFEEMRVNHYLGIANGNIQPAIQMQQELFNRAEQQIRTVLNDLNGAAQYIVDGGKQHPNRLDLCREYTGKAFPNNTGQILAGITSTSSSTSAFGQPSSFGVAPGPSSSQEFSTLNQPQQSQFGRPPAFGQQNAFGSPSNLGVQATAFNQAASSFGQPSSSTQTSAFGQPSTLGPQQQIGTLGASTGMGGVSSSLGQAAGQVPPPFGSSQVGQQSTSFGAQPQASTVGFTQSNTPGFGQARPFNNANPFAQQQNPTAPAFSAPFTTGNHSNPSSAPFGSGSSTQGSSSYGQSNWNATSSSKTVGSHVNATYAADGKTLVTWKNQPVQYLKETEAFYRPTGSNNIERIWHPNGAPPLNKWADPPADMNTPDIKSAYQFFNEHGIFELGIIPEVAPSRDMVIWSV